MEKPFTIYKLIVLYMADNARGALTNSQISEFVLEHDYTDYLQLQEVLSELYETGLMSKKTLFNRSYYEITDEGKKILPYLEQDLSVEIRREIRDYLKNAGFTVENLFQTPADYFKTSRGSWAVRCQIAENGTAIFDLTMDVPNKESAEAICAAWPSRGQEIYASVIGDLI